MCLVLHCMFFRPKKKENQQRRDVVLKPSSNKRTMIGVLKNTIHFLWSRWWSKNWIGLDQHWVWRGHESDTLFLARLISLYCEIREMPVHAVIQCQSFTDTFGADVRKSSKDILACVRIRPARSGDRSTGPEDVIVKWVTTPLDMRGSQSL